MDKTSNFIGGYFREYLKATRFDRRILARLLEFDYADNDRMICGYLVKKDYLWKDEEVVAWCKALKISEKAPVYGKLLSKAGKRVL